MKTKWTSLPAIAAFSSACGLAPDLTYYEDDHQILYVNGICGATQTTASPDGARTQIFHRKTGCHIKAQFPARSVRTSGCPEGTSAIAEKNGRDLSITIPQCVLNCGMMLRRK